MAVSLTARINDIFTRFERNNPHPKSELNFSNNYQLLVAVVLSAQTTDSAVNKVTAELFTLAPSAQTMILLGEEKVRDIIKSLGLFRTKARNIVLLSKMLVENFLGNVPSDFVQLLKLPGVGRKSANVVLNLGFGQESFPVDTHVFRVSNRLRLAPGKNPLVVEKKLDKIIPKIFRTRAHSWLILHGRYICRAKKPKCNICLINDLCPSLKQFCRQ